MGKGASLVLTCWTITHSSSGSFTEFVMPVRINTPPTTVELLSRYVQVYIPYTPWNIMEYMPTLTPLAPPQLIGIYASPMECLGMLQLMNSSTRKATHHDILPPSNNHGSGRFGL